MISAPTEETWLSVLLLGEGSYTVKSEGMHSNPLRASSYLTAKGCNLSYIDMVMFFNFIPDVVSNLRLVSLLFFLSSELDKASLKRREL